ncbi:MAG: hypothetical protein Q4F97_12710 [Bacteroidales bacterium]|nr:hypothetical protein [Bacteroidales bacterium]
MKKNILFVFLLALVSLADAITVYTLDEQFSQSNQTVLRFRIENNSNDTLNGIELRYNVVQDSSKISIPELYYLPEGMANWTFEDSVNATLVIYFPKENLAVVGQSGKNFYGAIYAKSIVVHQNTKVIWVPFVEEQANTVVANIDNTAIQNYTTHFWER